MMPLALVRRLVALYRGLPLLAQLGIPIAVALVAYIGVLRIQRDRARARAEQLALDKLNFQAAADRTHRVDSATAATIRKLYGDSVAGLQKLVRQEAQRADAVTRALHLSQVFSGTLQLRFDSLHAVLASSPVVTDSADVRHATFHVDSIRPYHVHADVDLPPAPAVGSMRLGISQDPARGRAILGCGPKNADGLRPASLTLLLSSSVQVQLDSLTQAPEVCNAAALEPAHGWRLPAWLLPVSAALGWLAAQIF
jgi:hypothetical protein